MNTEKKSRWIYWALTAPFLVIMLPEGITMLAGASIFVNGMKTLGYPAYICRILGAAKLLGSIAILQTGSGSLKNGPMQVLLL